MPIAAIIAAATLIQQPSIEFRTQFETEKDKFNLKFEYPRFMGKSKLEEFANTTILKKLGTAEEEFLGAVQGFDEIPTTPWEIDITGIVSLKSPTLISVLLEHYEFTGGAHPNGFTHSINVALINNKPQSITLKHIVAPGKSTSAIIDGLVKPKLNEQKMARVNEPLSEFPADAESKFIVSKNGLTFLFDKYSVGPYVEGEYIVKLNWNELKGLINTKIVPQAK